VARGYTNVEVAVALQISPNTIKKHLKHLFARLAVANRTELATLVSFHSPWLLEPAGLPG
jgi:DNA-binding CsgD family transcriptional regulator